MAEEDSRARPLKASLDLQTGGATQVSRMERRQPSSIEYTLRADSRITIHELIGEVCVPPQTVREDVVTGARGTETTCDDGGQLSVSVREPPSNVAHRCASVPVTARKPPEGARVPWVE